MTLWCPLSFRILLTALIPNTDAVDMILRFAKKEYDKEAQEHHEGITANYKVNGLQGWLKMLKSKHYDYDNASMCLTSFPKTKYNSEFPRIQLDPYGFGREGSVHKTIGHWPNYRSLGFTRTRYVEGYDETNYFNIFTNIIYNDYINIMDNLHYNINNYETTGYLNNFQESFKVRKSKKNTKRKTLRYIPKKYVYGAGGKLAHMKKTNSDYPVKTGFSDIKYRVAYTKKEKRQRRIDKKDMRIMNRQQMKRCYVY
jgi:hypothetical protein